MRKNRLIQSGFSLMEMMVVLLIVSVVAAASAPMISKTMVHSAGDGSPWVWLGTDGNIAYNMDSANITAAIGTMSIPTIPNAGIPRLYIDGNSTNPYLTLENNDNYMHLRYNGSGISLTGASDNNIANNSIAIGDNARSSGPESIAIGHNTEAANSTVLIGNNARSPHDNRTAGGFYSTAVGDSANSSGDFTTAIGASSRASGTSGVVAVGYSSEASGGAAAAIGLRATANNQDAISIGRNGTIGGVTTSAGARNERAIAIGTNASALGADSIAIGSAGMGQNGVNTGAVGANTIAIGRLASTIGSDGNGKANAIAFGNSAKARNNNAIAIGNDSTAGGADGAENSIAIGNGATTTRNNSIAFGTSAEANKNGEVAIGTRAHTFGVCSVAVGPDAVAGGNRTGTSPNYNFYGVGAGGAGADYATAIGVDARAMTLNSVAIGRASVAGTHDANNIAQTMDNCIAIGTGSFQHDTDNTVNGAVALAENSMALGQGAWVSNPTHTNSAAIGYGAKTTTANQIVLGNADTTVYIPGRLVVDKDAWLAVGGEGNYTYFATMEKSANGNGEAGTYKRRRIFEGDVAKNIKADGPGGSTSNGYAYPSLSDRRLKNVGEVFKGGLEELKKLEIFHFTYKKDENKTPHVGVMAQDLQKVFPDAVIKGDDGFLRIRMEDMFYALVNAVKELDNKITELANQFKAHLDEVAVLKKTVADQQTEIAELKSLVEKQSQEISELSDEVVKQNALIEKRIKKLEKKLK